MPGEFVFFGPTRNGRPNGGKYRRQYVSARQSPARPVRIHSLSEA